MRRAIALAIAAAALMVYASLVAGCAGAGSVRLSAAPEQPGQAVTHAMQSPSPERAVAYTPTSVSTAEGQVATQTPASAAGLSPTATHPIAPTPSTPVATLTSAPVQAATSAATAGGLPIYVQVVQVILMPGADSATAIVDLSPNNVFAFDPGLRSLAVRPAISIAPETQVIIGLTTVIQQTGAAQVRGQLYQLPADVAEPVGLTAVEVGASTVTLTHAGQTFGLGPGESRSFRRPAGEATVLTVITNHGRLASVKPLSTDPGAR